MHNDDQPVGRLLSRREALALLTSTGVGLLAACAGIPVSGQAQPAQPPAAGLQPTATGLILPTLTTFPLRVATSPAKASALPVCVARPQQTEGPYFRDEKLNRQDIRTDPSSGKITAGLPLLLTFVVSQVNGGCSPLPGATVDIWHCDSQGIYSDVSDPHFDTSGQKFLRGYQVTDDSGTARFTTIYPGWYQGRTVHIHFKVRTTTPAGQHYEFTSQIYFQDELTDQVFSKAPYASRGQRSTRNDADAIFGQGGDQLVLALQPAADGYQTVFNIGLQI